MPDDAIADCRRRVAQALLDLRDEDDDHPNPNIDSLVQRAARLQQPAITRLVAEDALGWWVQAAESSLRDHERFAHLNSLIDRLPPLKLESRADRVGRGYELVKAARARDHLRVWRSIWIGLNDRELKHAMLPSGWWPKRDKAIRAAEKALLRVCSVISESSADPGLLGLSFAPVLRAFHEFKNPRPEAFDGRGHVLRVLVATTPRAIGWSRGGRFVASWLSRTTAELRQWGVRGEGVKDLLDAAGLVGRSPTRKSSRKKPKSNQNRR